jgi:hypothetical protein
MKNKYGLKGLFITASLTVSLAAFAPVIFAQGAGAGGGAGTGAAGGSAALGSGAGNSGATTTSPSTLGGSVSGSSNDPAHPGTTAGDTAVNPKTSMNPGTAINPSMGGGASSANPSGNTVHGNSSSRGD